MSGHTARVSLIKHALHSFAFCLYCILRGLPFYTAVYGAFLSFESGLATNPQLVQHISLTQKIFTLNNRVSTLPFPGGRIQRPNDRLVDIMTGMYQIFVDKEYEKDRRYSPQQGDVIVDGGAFIGLWTLRVAQVSGKSGRIIAVEPNPLAYAQLQNNIRLNNLGNVTTVNKALGDQNGKIDLFTEARGFSATSLFRNHVETFVPKTGVTSVKCEMTTIDDLVSDYDVKQVDILKIDVEGAELAVLHGASKSFEKKIIHKIVVEVHEDICSKQSIIDYLVSNNFIIDRQTDYPDPALCNRVLIYSRLAT